jgi:hypothetical protein
MIYCPYCEDCKEFYVPEFPEKVACPKCGAVPDDKDKDETDD